MIFACNTMNDTRGIFRRHLTGHIVSLAFGLCLFAAPAAAQDAQDAKNSETYQIRNPGTVLVDRETRLRELAGMGGDRERLCRMETPWPEPSADVRPLVIMEGRLAGSVNDRMLTPFDWSVALYGAEAFGAVSPRAHENFMTLVTTWARADALTEIADDLVGSNTAVLFDLKRTLATLIPNWAIVRADPHTSDDDRKLVDKWIGRLVTLADANTGTTQPRATRVVDCPGNERTSNCNNHRYLRDEVNIMWAALTGDDARFRKGVERVKVALRQMRPDGSLPLETERGARAVWYQNYAVAMLVTIAEVAAQQGYDLYGMETGGRSIHKAVTFLLDAIVRPPTVLEYARTNRQPGPGGADWREQDLRFTELRERWHHMAWIEAYVRRFPDHPNSIRLHRDMPGLFLDRPLISRIAGGMTSCLYATPD